MGYLFYACLSLIIITIIRPTFSNAPILYASDCPSLRVRRRWGDISSDDKANFIKAVLLLKKVAEKPEPSCDPTSLYQMLVTVHMWNYTLLGSNTNWAHNHLGFLSWHRHFLYTMETLLRVVATQYNQNLTAQGKTTGFMNPCICVPWWDWENDWKKELYSSIWGADYFGTNKSGCVSSGPLSNWTDSTGKCLYRTNSARGYGGIQTGPASLMTLIASNPNFTAFHNAVVLHPHGDAHLYIGGAVGPMGGMSSPDDPLFWIHHCNIDRIWAMWTDCYDYDKVPASAITDTILPYSWTIMMDGTSNTMPATRNDVMPYYYLAIDPNKVATRFKPTPTAAQMLSMGTATQPGFNGYYVRYGGPDLLVTTMTTTFPGTCNFDTGLVNYITSPVKRDIAPKIIFNSTALQEQLDRITKMWPRRTNYQKLHYLSLWECAISNRDPTRDYTTLPSAWLKMNSQKESNWKTICQAEGWLNGYDTLAFLEDSQDSVIPMTTSNIIIILCSSLGVLILVGVIAFIIYTRKQSSDTEVLDVNSALNEPMINDETSTI